jgi:poly-gamma-glutamate synthesis protein (capsule biosynthesis protein)
VRAVGALPVLLLLGCGPVWIAAAGDLQLGSRSAAAQVRAVGALLGPGVRLVNLEGPITSHGAESAAPPRFRAPPQAAAWLRGQIDIAGLANNHALDQGPAGRAETVVLLAAQGIRAAHEQQDAELSVRGRRIVVIARDLSAGIGAAEEADLVQAVARARRRGVVLVSLHWGRAGSLLPAPAQQRLARRLIDSGAAAVLGHGPHTLQGIERRGRGVIAYSLGNLAFSCDCTDVHDAYVLRLRLERDGGVAEARALPISAGLLGEPPRRCRDPGLLDLIETLSRDLGSRTFRTESEIVIR